MSDTVDAVIVGSGHNGLITGAYLARAGWSVRVLERAPVPGGCIATEELTVPGFRHDTLSGYHLVFHGNKAWPELQDELTARGLQYVNHEIPCGGVMSDGAHAVMRRGVEETADGLPAVDRDAYVRELGAFATVGPALGELLSDELTSLSGLRDALRLVRGIGDRHDDLIFSHPHQPTWQRATSTASRETRTPERVTWTSHSSSARCPATARMRRRSTRCGWSERRPFPDPV